MLVILIVGVKERILEGINTTVCLCNCLEAGLSWMDHHVLPAMFLPIVMATISRTERALSMSLVLSDRNSICANHHIKHLGWSMFEATLEPCGGWHLGGAALGQEPLTANAEPAPNDWQYAELSLVILALAAASLPACLPANLVAHLLLLFDCGHVSTLELLTPNDVVEIAAVYFLILN